MGQLPVTGRVHAEPEPDDAEARGPGTEQPRKQPSSRDDRPVLPRRAESERDEAWGDRPRSAERDADWYREQRPPHHE